MVHTDFVEKAGSNWQNLMKIIDDFKLVYLSIDDILMRNKFDYISIVNSAISRVRYSITIRIFFSSIAFRVKRFRIKVNSS
jgi:hypothetical protein